MALVCSQFRTDGRAAVAEGRKMPDSEKRALVIGNANYKTATVLDNPLNDAVRVADALDRLGFAVTIAKDCDINDFDNELRSFTRQLEGSDVALLYYSGHALQLHGENYLVPVD